MQSWSNLHRIHFQSTMEGYPILKPTPYKHIEKWIGLNEVLTYKGDKATTGVHFFLDDHQFERVYTQPKKWVNELRQFGAVLTPDFSMYTDFALPIQKYNKYRNSWCGALWQHLGITVYPTALWSDEKSFNWCFDGLPTNSVIAVSNIGCAKNFEEEFKKGYAQMIKRLKPSKILLFGSQMEGLEGNIEFVKCGGFHGKKE